MKHYELDISNYLGYVPVIFHFRYSSRKKEGESHIFQERPIRVFVQAGESVAKSLFPSWEGGLANTENRKKFRDLFAFATSVLVKKNREKPLLPTQTVWIGGEFFFCVFEDDALLFEPMESDESYDSSPDFAFSYNPCTEPDGK